MLTCEGIGGKGGLVDSVESIRGGTFGFTRGRVMFCARLGRLHGRGWLSGLRGLGLEQHEKPGNVFSLVAPQGPPPPAPSGVVAALADGAATLLQVCRRCCGSSDAALQGSGCPPQPPPPPSSTAAAATDTAAAAAGFGGGGGMMKDEISSDVSTLQARFSSGRPLHACGGGGMVIVAKNDSRSRFMRFVLFLIPLSSTESMDGEKEKKIIIIYM